MAIPEQNSTEPTIDKGHRERPIKLLTFGLLFLVPASLLLSLSVGTLTIPIESVLASIVWLDSSHAINTVVNDIRLPRSILAGLIGGILAICGAACQGLFRNPLADPSLIGVTAGASAGAAVAIYAASNVIFFSGIYGLSLVSLSAFTGGVIAVTGVYMLATDKTGTSVATMLLAGIAITAIAGALTSFIEYFADNENLRRISLWRMGGLEGANSIRVNLAIIVSFAVFALLPRYSSALNALLLGESEARHLGISVQAVKLKLIMIIALGVGVSVALAGSIAFVGLVVPHIIRLIVGPNHRYLLPLSALGGAALLLLADSIARTLFAPIELPVGLVTALLGAPFFISLLSTRKHFGMET
ncbi:MAG: iron ABC transporter permease [Gammaproteobacteria bacterium]|nr:iron ABC transporter permease [Gammaproteobacteria bacterium]